jgi:RNA methyltransferase, TrmH family
LFCLCQVIEKPRAKRRVLIRSADNSKLKTIRKLRQKHWREKLGLFAAEGEDLVAAAERAGWEPEFVLHAGRDVEPDVLREVSELGSGSRAIGVYAQRFSEPGGELMIWLHGVGDPGNVGTVLRAAHALCDGPLVLGPGCADPYSPKAVRASMGSIFARPPARAGFEELPCQRIALDARTGEDIRAVGLMEAVAVCAGAERRGLPESALAGADAVARIPLRPDGPDSLNVAMAVTVALYEVGTRMAAHA